jgi:hypothetical protein
MQRQFNA